LVSGHLFKIENVQDKQLHMRNNISSNTVKYKWVVLYGFKFFIQRRKGRGNKNGKIKKTMVNVWITKKVKNKKKKFFQFLIY
jgi:hypothetical protein